MFPVAVWAHWLNNAAGIASPLVVIPHLIKCLGPEQYGKLALVQIVSFATLPFVDFGLSISGPKLSGALVSRCGVHQGIYITSFAHFLPWAVATLMGFTYISISRPEMYLEYLVCQISVLATYFPAAYLIFYLNKQVVFGVVGLIAKLIQVLAVLFLVRQQGDEMHFFVSQALIAIISSAVLFYSLTYRLESRIDDVGGEAKWRYSINLLTEGLPNLLRRAASTPITMGAAFLVNKLYGPAGVALYAIADKIRTVAWQAVTPVISSFAAKYFSVRSGDIGARSLERRTEFILASLALCMLLPCILFPSHILKFLHFAPSGGNIFVWVVASISIVSGTILAYVSAKELPIIGANAALTRSYWILSILCLAGGAVAIAWKGVVAAVSIMTVWELTVAYQLVRYGALVKR